MAGSAAQGASAATGLPSNEVSVTGPCFLLHRRASWPAVSAPSTVTRDALPSSRTMVMATIVTRL